MSTSKRRVIGVVGALIAAGLLGGCSSASVGGDETVSQADKALELQLETSLRNVASAEETYRATNGSYSLDMNALRSAGLNVPPSVVLTAKTADASTYCVEATHSELPGVIWHTSAGGAPVTGAC